MNKIASKKDAKGRLLPGTKVRTTTPNMSMRSQWTEDAWKERKWGVKGEVTAYHDAHGLYYDIRHEDGTQAGYDPSELKVL